MSRNFMILTNLSIFIFSINSAFALTCCNDYSGTSGCTGNKTPAGNCETLGYYTADVANCGHYIYCPFDTSYKRCTSTDKCNKNKDPNCLTWSSTEADCTCTRCKDEYTLVGGKCTLSYASCESAGYVDEERECDRCDVIYIYLSSGTKKTCYTNCEQDGSCTGGSSGGSSSGGNTGITNDLYDDCVESCADKCSMNSDSCDNYQPCVSNCSGCVSSCKDKCNSASCVSTYNQCMHYCGMF